MSHPDSPNASTSTIPKPEERSTRKLKLPRIERACESCRRRKIRCQGGSDEAPCANCQLAGMGCHFEARKEKRPAPPKGYVESLEQRVEQLEKLLAQFNDSNAPSVVDSASPNDATCDEAAQGAGQTPDLDDAAASLHNDLSQLSIANKIAVTKERFFGPGASIHLFFTVYDQILKGTLAGIDVEQRFSQSTVRASLVDDVLTEEHTQEILEHDLPDFDLASNLVDAYFDNVDSEIQLLHRPSFDKAVAGDLLDCESSFRSLYFVVLALGARFVKDDRITSAVPDYPSHPEGTEHARGFNFIQASRVASSCTITKSGDKSGDLFELQALALWIIWMGGSSVPTSAWMASGLAVRRAVDYGVHREYTLNKWNKSPAVDQLRRRAFHVLNLLDRQISTSLGRPCTLQEEEFNVAYPLPLTDEALSEWDSRAPQSAPPPTLPNAISPLDAIIALFSLQSIATKASRLLYSMRNQHLSKAEIKDAVSLLDSELNQWLHTIPRHLRWDPTNQDPRWRRQTAMLYLEYYSTQILIHREFLVPSRAGLHPFPSLAICANGSRSTAHILDNLHTNSDLHAAFWYAPMKASASGLILFISSLVNGRTETLSSSALKDIKKMVAVLDTLAVNTWLASRCGLGLKQLLEATCKLKSLKRPSEGDPSESPSSTDLVSADTPPVDTPSDEFFPTARAAKHAKFDLPTSTDELALPTYLGLPTFKPWSSLPQGEAMEFATPPQPFPLPSQPTLPMFDQQFSAFATSSYSQQSTFTSPPPPAMFNFPSGNDAVTGSGEEGAQFSGAPPSFNFDEFLNLPRGESPVLRPGVNDFAMPPEWETFRTLGLDLDNLFMNLGGQGL